MIRRQIPLFASDFTLFIIYLLPVKHAADLRTLNWARGRGWIPIFTQTLTIKLWPESLGASLPWSGDHMALAAHLRLPRHPLPALLMFFVECPPVLSLSPSDVRLRAGPGTADWLLVPGHPHHSAPAPVGDKFESWCCSHLGSPGQQQPPAQASVRPLIRCLLPLPPTLRCVHSPRAQTIHIYQGFKF